MSSDLFIDYACLPYYIGRP